MSMENYILSKYNFFKISDNAVAGVNLRNKMLFAIDLDKYEKLTSFADNLNEFKANDPVLFSTMYKLGIIEEKEIDQNHSRALLLQNRIRVFSENSYKLTINPTLNCNFSCWYCYETHNNKRMTKPTVEATLKYIENLITVRKLSSFHLDWFGGEPLLTYETVMKPIALGTKKICDANGVKLISGITTNGYLITKEMIPFFKEINMNSFQITLDGKKEIHNTIRFPKHKKDSYDKIIENICLLADRLKPENLAMRINYTAESFSGLLGIIDTVPKKYRRYITVLLQQVWQDKDNNKILLSDIQETKFKFEEAGFKIDENILDCKGYKCYADLFNQAVINYDGRVFKCTARNFEKEKEDGLLTEDGDIKWNDLLSLKMAKSTFENEKCMECKYLPVCFGPCSQKISTITTPSDFDKFCFEKGIESTIDYILSTFINSGKALAPIFEYRITK